MPVNIEIKARCSDPELVQQKLLSLKADPKGTDHQIDTYFHVDRGRLKLREGNIENNLIYYNRNDQAGPKKSEVILYPATNDNSLKKILTEVMGIKVVVDKYRDIYFIGNVKFHLDRVEALGNFVEIEAIGESGEEENLENQCREYMALLGIDEAMLVSRSYSELIVQKG